MEETVYPAINDNVNFLSFWSPLSRPELPARPRAASATPSTARGSSGATSRRRSAATRAILREIWERADAQGPNLARQLLPPGGPARAHRTRARLRRRVRAFATANRRRDYEDAEDAGYPTPPLARTFAVGPSRPYRLEVVEDQPPGGAFLCVQAGSTGAGGNARLEGRRLPPEGLRRDADHRRSRTTRRYAPAQAEPPRRVQREHALRERRVSSASRSSSRTGAPESAPVGDSSRARPPPRASGTRSTTASASSSAGNCFP